VVARKASLFYAGAWRFGMNVPRGVLVTEDRHCDNKLP
jgi:hypothetical protein